VIRGLETWSRERSDGVLSDVALMPLDRRELVWGRWLHTGLLFAVVLLLMLPCYLIVGSGTSGMMEAHFDPVTLLALILRSEPAGVSFDGLARGLVMLLKDASVLAFALSVSFWLSARCRSRLRATVLAWLGVIAAVLLLDPAVWWLLLRRQMETMVQVPDYLLGAESITRLVVKGINMLFWLICWGGLAGRLLISYLAVRAVAVNFDRYVLGSHAEM
jgi:hypothetical protein